MQLERNKKINRQKGRVCLCSLRNGVLMFINYSIPCLSIIISAMFLYSFSRAISRGNFPLYDLMLRSHPLRSSFLTILPLPDMTAKCKGVMPNVNYCLSIYAPQEMRAYAAFYIPLQHAQWRGVLPLASATPILRPLFKK